MTAYCVKCVFCDGHIHVRAVDLAACVVLADKAVEIHLAQHVDEMVAEVVS